MKKTNLVVLVFILVFSSQITFSQTKITEASNSLKAGKWALQFTIDQNFTLSNFEGSIASIKKQFSPNRALRLGLSVDFGHLNGEQNYRNSYDTIQPEFQKSTSYSAFIYPTYLFYINPTSEVNVYFGTGLTIGGKYHWRESEQNFENGGVNYSWEKYYSYGGGITGTVGVEFFPMKSFSIIAEYFVSLQYSHQVEKYVHNTPNQYSVRDGSYDQIEFFGKRVNFGLSVYF